MTHATVLFALSMALVGLAFGIGYFAVLRRNVALLAEHRGWLVASTLTLGRIGAATVLLAAVAQLGAAPLLATFAGFLLARSVALRMTRSTE